MVLIWPRCPGRNRTKIGRFRFLTSFGSAMYGMHLALGNIETYFMENV